MSGAIFHLPSHRGPRLPGGADSCRLQLPSLQVGFGWILVGANNYNVALRKSIYLYGHKTYDEEFYD